MRIAELSVIGVDMVFKKGQELDVIIEKVSYGGRGVARVSNVVIFVRNSLPGQKVRIKIIKKRSSYMEAIPLQVLEESPWAIQPGCEHFGSCGGCIWQNLQYEKQLAIKTDQVKECLEHIGGIYGIEFLPTIPSPMVYYYRNKLEFSFSPRRWLLTDEIEKNHIIKAKDFALGFHARGYWQKVVDIDSCLLQSPMTTKIVQIVKQVSLESGLRPYDTLTHQGFWRFLVIRQSKTQDNFLVNLITASSDEETSSRVIDEIAQRLQKESSQISSFIHSVSDKKAQIAFAETQQIIFGSGVLVEKLGDLEFSFSVNSFFQTNTLGAKRLYDTIKEFINPKGGEIVWDLYCGAGTIGIYIAREVKSVMGIELLPEAIEDAHLNCGINNIDNCYFYAANLKEFSQRLKNLVEKHGQPDVIITDPPRTGLDKEVTDTLLDIGAQRIIGVSCNPTTLARDARILSCAYRAVRIRVIDLFPHTAHMETVCLFEKTL